MRITIETDEAVTTHAGAQASGAETAMAMDTAAGVPAADPGVADAVERAAAADATSAGPAPPELAVDGAPPPFVPEPGSPGATPPTATEAVPGESAGGAPDFAVGTTVEETVPDSGGMDDDSPGGGAPVEDGASGA